MHRIRHLYDDNSIIYDIHYTPQPGRYTATIFRERDLLDCCYVYAYN